MTSSSLGVSVIIPAYNEEKTIAGVIEAARGNRKVEEIIVISDGSTDHTVDEVRRIKGVTLLDYTVNRGKGYALCRGIRETRFPVVVLLDADLLGLEPRHIDRLIEPLEEGRADLVLAAIELFKEEEKRYLEFFKDPLHWWLSNYSILISGQRAGYRKDLVRINNIEDSNYGVDLLITDYYLANEKRIKRLIFDDVHQRRKTEKWEKEGWKLYARMNRDILKTFGRLEAKKEVLTQGFKSKKENLSKIYGED